MDRAERINKLVDDINALVDECRNDNLITYAEIVGVLELVKLDLYIEVKIGRAHV